MRDGGEVESTEFQEIEGVRMFSTARIYADREGEFCELCLQTVGEVCRMSATDLHPGNHHITREVAFCFGCAARLVNLFGARDKELYCGVLCDRDNDTAL